MSRRASPAIVPPNRALATLVILAAAASALLAAFALAFGLASARLADRWADTLAGAATLRISAPPGEADAALAAALKVLEETPGIRTARPLDDAEQRALLEPWLGAGAPLDALPLPRLVAIEQAGDGPDLESLRRRLAGEVPGAVYDDHARWREPIRATSAALQALAAGALALTLMLTLVVVGLAARATLAAHDGVLTTLRLIGADDAFVTRGFVRRFVARALAGAGLGTAAAAGLLALLPGPGDAGETVLTGLAPHGAEWALLLPLPLLAGLSAWGATRWATRRALLRLS